MIRNIDISEISDGRLYSSNDMAKVDTKDCAGCSKCCQGMGESIILDPLDVCRLSKGLQMSFEELMSKYIELNVVDGVILPNLRMQEKTDSCGFLNRTGRCSIHSIRPGFCRMFPLGRVYEDGDFKYFLQVKECPAAGKTKMKIKKWLSTENLATYEKFVKEWHFFLKDLEAVLEQNRKEISMKLLQVFYVAPWGDGDFYEEFGKRLQIMKEELKKE